MRALILLTVLVWSPTWVARGEHSEERFDVSLWSSHADMSADYQRLIREATEAYRGDFVGYASVIVRTYVSYIYPGGMRISPLEPPIEFGGRYDSFPSEPFTLTRRLAIDDPDATPLSLQRHQHLTNR